MPGVSSGAQAPVALIVMPAETCVPSLSFMTPPRRVRAAATPTRTSAPRCTGAIEQITGGAGRIDDGIVGHEQGAGQSGAEIGFGFGESAAVQYFGAHADAFIDDAFAFDFGHLFVVRGDPKRAGIEVFDIGGELRRESDPQIARVIGEGDLGGRIVHDDDVSHARGGGAAADHAGLDDEDAESRCRALGRAGGAHDAAAGDRYVVACAHEARIPKQNGSASSRMRSLSAFT